MSSLTHIEKRIFEELFNMASGYVLDLNEQHYASLFREVGININDQKYLMGGNSKAKRLRCFWDIESDNIIGKILEQMLKAWLHLQPDKKKALIDGNYIDAEKIVNRLFGRKPKAANTEADFLNINFSKISFSNLKIESSLIPILEDRFQEIKNCLHSQPSSPLAAVILIGSVLEGVLLGFATLDKKSFNEAETSPKDKEKKVYPFNKWTLGNFIDVAHEIRLLKEDVKKFSHVLRDFRNYIHPFQQMTSKFSPDNHTAEICLQVLKAAIADLSGER